MGGPIGNPIAPERIAEIQRRYLAGELRHLIARDMGLSDSVIFRYCKDVHLPGSKAPLPNGTITELMQGWR